MPTPSATAPAVAAAGVVSRTWKSRDGMFSVDARFAGSAGGKVTLLRSTGDRIDVALDQLSQDDQDYVA